MIKRMYHNWKYFRQVKVLVAFGGYPGLASFIPDFVRIPLWLMHFGSYKF